MAELLGKPIVFVNSLGEAYEPQPEITLYTVDGDFLRALVRAAAEQTDSEMREPIADLSIEARVE